MSSISTPRIQLDLRATTSHLVEVELELHPPHTCLRWSLPAWTPGSYLIRDYVRQLEGLTLWQAGQALALRRTGVASWQADLPCLAPVRLAYRILATELTVRTCHLDGDHGFLALAAVVVQVEGLRWQPHQLSLTLPPSWHAFVPLPRQPDGTWLAQCFDQLVDTPVEVGPHREHTFAVAGVPHRWVSWGTTLAGHDPVDADPALLADVERLCLACCRLLEEPRPAAAHYLFVLHLTENGYGGLEHDHSSVLQFGRRRLAEAGGRRKLLQLVAHEYLHQWNVRRLRPAELVPYDYDNPTVVPTLWFAEGITSYLDQLLVHAAGCCSEAEALSDLAADLSRYRLCAGRAVQSLRASSEEAWVKLYKADAYAGNSQVSYYLKGAVIALVLDLHLRRCGSGLPVVLRRLWRSHGRQGRGYRERDLLEAFAAAAPDLATLLPHWLNATADPDLDAYLADVGLWLRPEQATMPSLGWQLEATPAGLHVQRVQRDGAAAAAGLMVGDELIALAEQRLRRPDDLPPLLEAFPAAADLSLAYVRDGRLRQTTIRAAPPAVQRWTLQPDPQASPTVRARRRAWLALELP